MVIFLSRIYRSETKKRWYAIRLFMPVNTTTRFVSGMSTLMYGYTPGRRFEGISFGENYKVNRINLNNAKHRISEIINQKDTVSVILFRFGDDSVYGDFVRVKDVLNIGGAKYYILQNNEIWFFNRQKDACIIPGTLDL